MHDAGLLQALAIGLASACLALVVFRGIGSGSIVALIATGVLLGPGGVALAGSAAELLAVAELGVVFLLFTIGLEVAPRRLWDMRREVLGLGSAQILLTTGLVSLTLGYLLELPAGSAVLAGFALAFSSTALGVRMLEERAAFGRPYGRAVFGVLLMQDMAVVPVLAAIPLLAGVDATGEELVTALARIALALAGAFVLGRWVLPWAFELVARQRNVEAFAALAALGVLGAAWLSQTAHLSASLGAFLVGVLLSRCRYHHQIAAEVAPFRSWLVALFFVAVGMSIDLAAIVERPVAILLPAFSLVAAKLGVVFALARLSGLPPAEALRAAALLAQGGEFAFVVFAAAVAAGVLDRETQTLGFVMISLSMAATPLVVALGDRLAARLPATAPEAAPSTTADDLDRHVVVAGYGRVGRAVVRMLEGAGIPYLAIDHDVVAVRSGWRDGHRVVYGNAADANLLAAVGVARAAAVVVTLDAATAAERVVTAVRTYHPHVRVIARAADHAVAARMRRAGVTDVFPETLELSIGLAESLLLSIGVPEDRVLDIARTVREEGKAHGA